MIEVEVAALKVVVGSSIDAALRRLPAMVALARPYSNVTIQVIAIADLTHGG